jgi:tetratricopeptide (TPR) repeat protein
MPLGAFLQAHRIISPDFRFESGFDAQAERFANRFLAVGSTLVAAQEYEAVHDYLAVARDLGLAEVRDQRLDELRLKQARALTMGGQYDSALGVLREPMTSGNPELSDERAQLLAQLYADTGQSAAVLETTISQPNAAFLRVKADAYFDRGEWSEAQAVYQQLWDEVGNELPLEDGIQFLLSAYRSNDLSTTAMLTKAFPDLTTIPQWSAIAEGLVDPAVELWPLRSDTARMRMDAASRALENVQSAVPGTN